MYIYTVVVEYEEYEELTTKLSQDAYSTYDKAVKFIESKGGIKVSDYVFKDNDITYFIHRMKVQ